jgi:hypothetical protein
MAKATVVEESEYHFEEGWLRARLESVVETKVEFEYKAHHAAVKNGTARVGQKATFDKWRWNFKITAGDSSGDTINVDSDAKVSTRADSVAKVLYESLQGAPVEVGQDVDTDLVEGLVCEVLVAHQAPQKKKDGTLGYYCTIVDARATAADANDSADPWANDSEPPF